MKKITKMLCFSMAAATMACSMAGCFGGGTSGGQSGNPNADLDGSLTLTVNEGATKSIVFEYLDAGFGDDPYIAVANAYMAKNKDVQVYLLPNVEIKNTVNSALTTNTNVSDIYSFDNESSIKTWGAKGLVEDLTDLLEEKTEDGVTMKDSMTGSAAKSVINGGKVYGVPEYTNVTGFVYNIGLFEQYGWSIPNTTADLEALCKQIIKDTSGKVSPIIWCEDGGGYLYFATENWIAQSAGVDKLNKFYEYGSKDVYALQDNDAGSLYSAKKGALENLMKFFLPSSEYVYDDSSTEQFMNAQRKILSGEAAMMLNGSWFQTEMAADMAKDAYKDAKIGMFAVPEMSDADGNVIRMGGNNSTDRVLSASYGAYYFIPSAAPAKEEAKDFLLYMSSKEACEVYTQYSNAIRPFNYDYSSTSAVYSKVSDFGKSVLKMADEYVLYAPVTLNPIATKGASLWLWDGRIEGAVMRDKGANDADYYLSEAQKTANAKWDSWTSKL